MVAESFSNCLGLVEGLNGEARGEEVRNRFLYGNKTYHVAACFEYESGSSCFETNLRLAER